MISIGIMIRRIATLADTRDASAFETEFINNIVNRTNDGKDTSRLSEKQIAVIESIHKKHFGDH